MCPEDFQQTLSEYRNQGEHQRSGYPKPSVDHDDCDVSVMVHPSDSCSLTNFKELLPPLPRISAFFPDTSVGPPPSRDTPPQPQTPALTVSTSELTFAAVIDSPKKEKIVKTTLAERRGKQQPSSLSLHPPPLAYPGIPTPYLGSPETGSTPKFDFAQNSAQSLSLSEMVYNLRSICPPPPTPSVEGWDKLSVQPFADIVENGVAPKDGEWAFAYDLMKDYLEQDEHLTSHLARQFLDNSKSRLSQQPFLPSITNTRLESGPPNIPLPTPPATPPVTVKPVSPTPAKTSPKRNVSVRFAPSPNKGSSGRKRSSTLGSQSSTRAPPSPLRQSFGPEEILTPPPKASGLRPPLMRRASMSPSLVTKGTPNKQRLSINNSNSKRPPPTPAVTRMGRIRRATINENDLRRTDEGATSSKIAMPLKKMFTRFR